MRRDGRREHRHAHDQQRKREEQGELPVRTQETQDLHGFASFSRGSSRLYDKSTTRLITIYSSAIHST